MRRPSAYILFISFGMFFWGTEATAESIQSARALEYIELYKDIAQQEMQRSGIPASIKLAQGIHESGAGKGSLALNANNHFGIKCKSHWTGPTYYIEDDDYQNGQLVKSCFRAYEQVGASYRDHTNFLMDNARYANLFQLPSNDYKAWAHGLKKCGYATDSRYAQKIIRLIERYQLHQYDETTQEAVPENYLAIQNDRNNAFQLLLEMEGMTANQADLLPATTVQEEAFDLAAVVNNQAQQTVTELLVQQESAAEEVVSNFDVNSRPQAMALPTDYRRNAAEEMAYTTGSNTNDVFQEEVMLDGEEEPTSDADQQPAQLFVPREAVRPAPSFRLPSEFQQAEYEEPAEEQQERRASTSKRYSRR
ncbi:MAG: glucosaminidase domain-containing protein [Bacteroidota bacterium]